MGEQADIECDYLRKGFVYRSARMMKAVEGASEIVLFDKACRPLGHLIEILWPLYCPDVNLPRFTHLNIGSEKIRRIEEYAWRRGKIIDRRPNQILPYINSREKLESVFGPEVIDGLKRRLSFLAGGLRLVVDDFESTGCTLTLAEEIFKALDPGRENRFFIFGIQPPWSQTEATLVADWDPERDGPGNPFFAVPETRPKQRKEGQRVLAQLEIVAGRLDPSQPPPRPLFG